MSPRIGACLGLCLAIAAGCGSDEGEAVAGANLAPEAVSPQERVRASTLGVDDARLVAAASDAANWLTHGRTYAEDRYSPLDQVNAGNVADLRLAWSFPTGLL